MAMWKERLKVTFRLKQILSGHACFGFCGTIRRHVVAGNRGAISGHRRHGLADGELSVGHRQIQTVPESTVRCACVPPAASQGAVNTTDGKERSERTVVE